MSYFTPEEVTRLRQLGNDVQWLMVMMRDTIGPNRIRDLFKHTIPDLQRQIDELKRENEELRRQIRSK
jgi:hypothetical protein